MKNILLVVFFLLPIIGFAQQLPNRSNFLEKSFIWNPAMTGLYNYWEVGMTYRQDWMGFTDSPRTATVNAQFPFADKNMSLGGFIMVDRTLPTEFNGITFSYAYKIDFGRRNPAQLSLGLMASLNEFDIDPSMILVNDFDDELIPMGSSSGISPNVGIGFFYTSNADRYQEEKGFFIGAAANQSYPANVALNAPKGNLRRAIHANAVAGVRLVKDKAFLEPSLWVNYAANNNINGNLSLKYEKLQSFWAALSYSTNQAVSFQAGYILKKGILKDGTMRIGTLGSYNLGGTGQGFGYEFYLAYQFENN